MHTPGLNSTINFLKKFPGRHFIQTFDDNKKRGLTNLIRSFQIDNANDFKNIYEELNDLNKQGAGIYFCVNECKGDRRIDINIKWVRSYFLDLDGSPLQPVLDFELKPSLVIQTSANKFHAYYILKIPIEANRNDFKKVQTLIAEKFAGDKSINDLPRVMRIPGFYNMKTEPFLIRERA